eukprot:GHUV01010566.1.p1 GENE.GHUV01010566.1~~GHUV01010566.1.p1  ORF type:complete len:453 (+),score=58.75 GHUV01010566.1:1879-3237(+)
MPSPRHQVAHAPALQPAGTPVLFPAFHCRCPNPASCHPANVTALTACAEALSLQGHQHIPASFSKLKCGGTGYANLQCSQGYYGILCGMCTLGYGHVKPFTCRKCLSRGLIIGLYLAAAVVLFGFMKLLCHFTLAETAASATQGLQTPGSRMHVTHLLKPLVLYFQYLLIIATLSIDWPEPLSYPVRALALVFSSTSPETLSVDCLFSAGGLPAAVKKVLFYLAAPLVMLVALLVVEGLILMFVRNKERVNASAVDRLASSAIVVLFFFLPSLARTTFSLFACVTVDKLGASSTDVGLAAVGRFWLLDLQQSCYEGYHLGWSLGLGVPLLLFICFALPGAIFGLAVKNTKQAVYHPSFARHYGFLFQTYKPSRCFWEGVIALQTVVMVAVSVYIWLYSWTLSTTSAQYCCPCARGHHSGAVQALCPENSTTHHGAWSLLFATDSGCNPNLSA